MAPAVSVVAMPQYTSNATSSSSSAANSGGDNHNSANNDFSYGGMKDGGGNNSTDSWNMDSALDFDLLAAYLLEDVGGGGFDFR
jgi:hypothetical protein